MYEEVAKKPNPTPLKPCYLLADSRLLFERDAGGASVLEDIVTNANSRRPSVAYIGASNGDDHSYYHDIFLPAVESVQAGERRLIVSNPPADDLRFLSQADIILLAGGSVEKGWNNFKENSLQSHIAKRYRAGALLLGISAGAIQLGRGGLTEDHSTIIPTFGFVGLYVGVHEERENWQSLRLTLSLRNSPAHGVGIPSGGGVMFYDGELYPIRKPLLEIEMGVIGSREREIYPHRFGHRNSYYEVNQQNN